MNTLETLFDMIIAILILILFPVVYMQSKKQAIGYEYLAQQTIQFTNEVTQLGLLSQSHYDSFYQSVSFYDELTSIEISYEKQVYEPVNAMHDSLQEIISYSAITTHGEIMNHLKKNSFQMDQGGFFQVILTFQTKSPLRYGGSIR